MQKHLSIQQILAEPQHTRLVIELLQGQTVLSRSALAKGLCRRLGLRDPKGDLRTSTTLKALRDLEAQGFWTLPVATVPRPRHWNSTRLSKPVKAPTAVPTRVEDVQGLQLVEATTQEEIKIWNELMIREHPLHQCRLVGRQLRYLVASDHGWLGAIGFGSAALYLEARDEWIGWDAAQRMEHLPRVLNMNRFLIRPQVRCDHLALQVLSLCIGRVPEDFERRYGVRPWLLESFVDSSRYEGACYKAANWIGVGQTKGRGRNGQRKEGKSIKDIYLYSLVDDLQVRIGVAPPVLEALEAASGLDAQGWANQEFGACDLGDPRRTRRLVKIVSDQAAQPSGSYSQAAGGNRHDLKGYYRFLNNQREELAPEGLLQTHRTRTIRRMKKEKTVLILQDTTELNFSARPGCKDLGQLGSNQTGAKSRGLDLHSCLAVGGLSGLPLGVLRLHGYAPEPAQGKDPSRPIEEKESYRWLQAYQDAADVAQMIPETRVISVADREADMFELFDHRRSLPGKKAELLVRAKWDRSLEGTEEKLFEELAATPLAKRVCLPVPRQREQLSKPSDPGRPGLPARNAQVEVRFKEVTINPPQTPRLKDKLPIKLWAIYLVEKNPPAGATAVRWMLLTSIPVVSVKQALKCVQWYCRRWRIEEWHRVMKSGCKILEHQNHTAGVLQRAIAIDAVIAWRIMLLALLGREVPELPSSILFDPCECEVLELLAKKKSSPSVKL
jgi:Domain of unknown function (DUF4338)/Transposase DNA-binding